MYIHTHTKHTNTRTHTNTHTHTHQHTHTHTHIPTHISALLISINVTAQLLYTCIYTHIPTHIPKHIDSYHACYHIILPISCECEDHDVLLKLKDTGSFMSSVNKCWSHHKLTTHVSHLICKKKGRGWVGCEESMENNHCGIDWLLRRSISGPVHSLRLSET